MICEVMNSQAIPRLIDLNGGTFKGITAYPELIHGDIETQDLEKLGTFVRDMIGIGAIMPDENLEDYLRMAADLPERDEETSYMSAARQLEGAEKPQGSKGKKPNAAVNTKNDGAKEPQEPERG
jgi:hypothetical protein